MRRTALLGLLAAACAPPPAPIVLEGIEGTQALFDVQGTFWRAPFPSDHRVDEASRKVDVEGFPNADGNTFVAALVGMLDDQVQGWGVSSPIYLPFEAPVSDALLPDLTGSVAPEALVWLMDVDRDSPELGRRFPVELSVRTSASPWGPATALVALPPPGLQLPMRRRLALVAQRALLDAEGKLLGQADAIVALAAGETPEGWRPDVAEQYLDALDVLEAQGLERRAIAALTVFTTGNPTAGWDALLEVARADGGLRLLRSPERVEAELHPDFCVFETAFDAPVFQGGTPPYTTEGGGFVFDEEGLPVVQARQRGRMFLTVPRDRFLPDARRTVVFVRTGGGGDRPLIDRGPRDAEGLSEALSGYAGTFARAGYAGIQIDGPLGGEFRNPAGADEQFLLFNVTNPVALRDNLRQTALELALLPDLLSRLTISAGGGCPDLSSDIRDPVRFDVTDLVLFGHSMGATVAPVAAWLEPSYRTLLLSGAGGSWIENVIYKESPIPTRPIAATIVGESEADLDRTHPVLALLQWAGEGADPPIYAPALVADPDTARNVLMVQGVRDTYIPPPVANALSLPLGLDLAGPALDASDAEPGRDLLSMLPWSGGAQRTLPAGLNRGTDGRPVTALVVQVAEDGVEDGHEVAYQVPTVRGQVRCFLEGLTTGQPILSSPLLEGEDCPPPPGEP